MKGDSLAAVGAGRRLSLEARRQRYLLIRMRIPAQHHEDILQEAAARWLAHVSKNEIEHPWAYFAAIVVNLAKQWWTQRARIDPDGKEEERVEPRSGPEAQATTRQLLARLFAALTERDQRVLELLADESSRKEIGEQLNIAPNTAYTYVYQARRRARAVLDRDAGEPMIFDASRKRRQTR